MPSQTNSKDKEKADYSACPACGKTSVLGEKCLECGAITVTRVAKCSKCGYDFASHTDGSISCGCGRFWSDGRGNVTAWRETTDSTDSTDVKTQKHYTQFVIQPMEFIGRNKLGFLEGNVVKYVCRYEMKNGLEDLKKAQHYLEKLIEREEKGTITL